MSTIKVDSIQATGETASRAVSGVAAAWVNFDGTGTAAIRNSTNVTSLTDNSTGNFTINFTSNFATSDYSALGTSHNAGTAYSSSPNMGISGTSSRAVGSCLFNPSTSITNVAQDCNITDGCYFGDLA